MHHDDQHGMVWARVRSSADLGGRIAHERRARVMTQADLATWVGVDRTTVIRLERGTTVQLVRLLDVLGVLGLDLVVVPRDATVVVVPTQRAVPPT